MLQQHTRLDAFHLLLHEEKADSIVLHLDAVPKQAILICGDRSQDSNSSMRLRYLQGGGARNMPYLDLGSSYMGVNTYQAPSSYMLTLSCLGRHVSYTSTEM